MSGDKFPINFVSPLTKFRLKSSVDLLEIILLPKKDLDADQKGHRESDFRVIGKQ